ncbi:MAG TPA: hypothetical protein VJ719_08640, partial [Chthoniobacterales bacterium]|nr:hypothetical protein [Chthoniobacterales bacterium]
MKFALKLVRNSGALFTVAFLSLAATSHAATISWGAAQDITSNADVSLSGTLVRAFDVVGSGTTINGVLFEPLAPGTTVGNFTLGPAGVAGTGANSSLSPEYQAMLHGAAFTVDNSTITLTINGLSVGETYLFQWWSNTRLALADTLT